MTQTGLILTVVVGGLQMFRVRAGVLTAYGGDVAGPLFLYGALRQGKTVLRRIMSRTPSAGAAAIGLFVACAAWETCQRVDLRGTPLDITRGRFDAFDLVTYGVTLWACFVADVRSGAQVGPVGNGGG